MAHSHDRTLLASLGFLDPDKREPLHDLACEYLSEPAQATRMARLAGAPETEDVATVPTLEAQIAKGEGQYRTTVGFLDLRIEWKTETAEGTVLVEVKIQPISIGDVLRQIALYRGHLKSVSLAAPVVLNKPVSAETFKDRLRELSGEKRSLGAAETVQDKGMSWFLATAFDLDAGQSQLIQQAGIVHVRLGDGFEKWFEERQRRPAPKPEEF